MRTRNAEHRSLYFIKCTLPLRYCLISIRNNSNIVGSKGKKRLPISQTSVLIWKIQYFGVAHPTLCCGPLFAIVVEITVKHLNRHICSQSAGGKEGAAFSGIAKWFLSSPGLFTCSLAAVCAEGIHNTTVRIPFCLLPGSEGRLLSLDSPPWLHRVLGKMASVL